MVEEDLAMDKMPQVKDNWKQGRNIPIQAIATTVYKKQRNAT